MWELADICDCKEKRLEEAEEAEKANKNDQVKLHVPAALKIVNGGLRMRTRKAMFKKERRI